MTFPDIVELPTITIASYQFAYDLLASSVSEQFTHVISINNPGEDPPRPLKAHKGQHLLLAFHDITDPPSGGMVPPSREDVEKILAFAEDIEGKHNVLVHCAAGISRSSAAALAIIASKLNPTAPNAQLAIEALLRIKDIIHPNHNMVVDTDHLLGYGGHLRAAYASTFQGGDLLWMPASLRDLEPED